MSPKKKNSRRQAPTNFELFPKLPTELRLKIWFKALPGPRTITVAIAAQFPDRYNLTHQESVKIATNPIATPLLHSDRECREVALKYYETAFEGCFNDYKQLYFDYAIDTLYVKYGAWESFCGGLQEGPRLDSVVEWQSKIQHLELEETGLREEEEEEEEEEEAKEEEAKERVALEVTEWWRCNVMKAGDEHPTLVFLTSNELHENENEDGYPKPKAKKTAKPPGISTSHSRRIAGNAVDETEA